MPSSHVKPFDIPKQQVWEAYRQVAANKGAPGVDGETLAQFEADLKNNLYKIWNRMSSGSYFPPPVRAVEIPKSHVCSVCPRSLHRARSSKSSPVSDSIVVTHPFHPLAGQRLVVIFEKARPGADRVVVCEGGAVGRVTLPVAWTDRAPTALSHRLAFEGLAEAAALVAALEHPPLAKRDRS